MPLPTPPDPLVLNGLRWLATGVAVLSFAVMILAILLGIAARYLGLRGVEWTFEVAAISFLWVSFFGVILAELNRENVALTLVTDRLHGRAAQVLAILGGLAVLWLAGALLFSGLAFAQKTGLAPTPVLRLPRLVQSLPLVGFTLGVLVITLARLVALLRQGAGR
ncbi:TRAP transporter small permease subunit [Rhodobacter sp. Har01]|uniref:TRAP transporter small permease n=1 Tax=Rhodobacter sp. Har01 TaxID=2883999 RepID=UPI001D05CE2C|nr:TRAP transporter small permease subunit [Rhodobacter sp. Har01]MCB6179081.1 TRAP transporter small permease subunit [Rhodobacter sp. Har01]